MTSIYATSPSSAFALPGSATSPKAHMMSTSPPRMTRKSSSGIASPRKIGMGSASSLQANGANVYVPPLHLPRGHDSSDVAALSASLDETLSLSRSLKSIQLHSTSPYNAHNGAGSSTMHQTNSGKTLVEEPHDDEPMGPFEGPEKLLELWFADSRNDVLDGGLMRVDRQVWENMLDIVKCKVLSVIQGDDVDAYLLSESSMFVFPHKLILKTCGTTTLLLGLERLLSIAFDTLKAADNPTPAESLNSMELGKFVKRCFYSRKSFMFPERQKGPHRDWLLEVGVLDEYFASGSAYTVGKMNGNHWLLYMTSPMQGMDAIGTVARPLRLPSLPRPTPPADETLEILMTHLSPASCARFEFPDSVATPDPATIACNEKDRGHLLGTQLSSSLGLTQLFDDTIVDAYAFEPCGFSANAIVKNQACKSTEDGYWTVHVTPEPDSSYASFETNIAACRDDKGLPWLVARVLSIFEPSRLSVTLFTSSTSSSPAPSLQDINEDNDGYKKVIANDGTIVSISQKQDQADILHSLQLKNYRRTDRIAYSFDEYDLTFVSFDRVDAVFPSQ